MDAPAAEQLSVNSLTVTGFMRGGEVVLIAWLGTCRHTNSHRCSLFRQAVINLHAWGYESLQERERGRTVKVK